MSKFKIGDRVRRFIGSSFTTESGKHEQGFIGVVSGFAFDGGEVIIFENGHRGYADKYEIWQPKVGDRVRYKTKAPHFGARLSDCGLTVKSVEDDGDVFVDYDDQSNYEQVCHISDIEPITAEAAAPAVAQVQPVARFKVGDKVRLVRDGLSTIGAVGWKGTIRSVGSEPHPYQIELDKGGSHKSRAITVDGFNWTYAGEDDIALDATLTITAGKFYKTSDGRKVGPMDNWVREQFREVEGDGRYWSADGLGHGGAKGEDLIAEWQEPANDNAEPAKPKFKVGDRVRLIDDVASFQEFGMEGRVIDVSSYGIEVDYSPHQAGECTEQIGNLELVTTTPAIVALIEDGEPKPATRPRVHPDAPSATTEAERLALEHPGQRFGVFVLADSKIADVVEEVVKKAVLRAA